MMTLLTKDRHLRGSSKKCPNCGSKKVLFDPKKTFMNYGPGLATCANCHCVWEAFLPEEVSDKTDPTAPFVSPCNNCAFRPGSPEQDDKEEWQKILNGVDAVATFHCHKGVLIDPKAEHGFAYPADRGKLRMCRGWLNAVGAKHCSWRRQGGAA